MWIPEANKEWNTIGKIVDHEIYSALKIILLNSTTIIL